MSHYSSERSSPRLYHHHQHSEPSSSFISSPQSSTSSTGFPLVPYPPWLDHALTSPTYLRKPCFVLSQREAQRGNFTAMSRRKAPDIDIDSEDSEVEHETIDRAYFIQIACLPENVDKNRYGGVEPYDWNRVRVGLEARYLNASWVREVAGGRWWIAAQAPLVHTTHTFLSLFIPTVPSQRPLPRIRTIVQLSVESEKGIRKTDPYFPDTLSEAWLIQPEPGSPASPLEVQLMKKKVIHDSQYERRTLMITTHLPGSQMPESFEVNHLLFKAWPDHGIPSPQSRKALLDFMSVVDLVNSVAKSTSSPDPPILVHCSAGIGRTGTFIALSSLLRTLGVLSPRYNRNAPVPPIPLSPLGPLPSEMEDDWVIREIDGLREQRMGMVENTEQIRFIYEMLHEALVKERRYSEGSY